MIDIEIPIRKSSIENVIMTICNLVEPCCIYTLIFMTGCAFGALLNLLFIFIKAALTSSLNSQASILPDFSVIFILFSGIIVVVISIIKMELINKGKLNIHFKSECKPL